MTTNETMQPVKKYTYIVVFNVIERPLNTVGIWRPTDIGEHKKSVFGKRKKFNLKIILEKQSKISFTLFL